MIFIFTCWNLKYIQVHLLTHACAITCSILVVDSIHLFYTCTSYCKGQAEVKYDQIGPYCSKIHKPYIIYERKKEHYVQLMVKIRR